MSATKTIKIVIAETAPVLLSGLTHCMKAIKDFSADVIEATSKEHLRDILGQEHIDILIANPTFGGLLAPDNLRKESRNPDLRILAIELGKLSAQALSLFDDHLHVTDDVETIKTKILMASNIEPSEPEEKESLSTREREVVSLVVKGFTNQEIADKLFLSIHTVITHRRNIARKLEIHSATGLTIYAIVNKIVDLSEIKL